MNVTVRRVICPAREMHWVGTSFDATHPDVDPDDQVRDIHRQDTSREGVSDWCGSNIAVTHMKKYSNESRKRTCISRER